MSLQNPGRLLRNVANMLPFWPISLINSSAHYCHRAHQAQTESNFEIVLQSTGQLDLQGLEKKTADQQQQCFAYLVYFFSHSRAIQNLMETHERVGKGRRDRESRLKWQGGL